MTMRAMVSVYALITSLIIFVSNNEMVANDAIISFFNNYDLNIKNFFF